MTEPQTAPRRRKMNGRILAILSVIAAFIIGIVAGSAGGGSAPQAASPAPTVTVTAAAGPASTVTAEPAPASTVTVTAAAPADATQQAAGAGAITEGTYEVPADVKPGKYRTTGAVDGPDGNCYWARLKSLDGGNADNIIDNNNSAGQQVVVIKASDKGFETAGCEPWVKTG